MPRLGTLVIITGLVMPDSRSEARVAVKATLPPVSRLNKPLRIWLTAETKGSSEAP